MPVLDNLKEVEQLLSVEGFHAEVVNDEQVGGGHAVEEPQQRCLYAVDGHLFEELVEVEVGGVEAAEAGLVAEGRSQPALAGAGRAGDTIKLAHDEVDTIGQLFDLFPAVNNSGENKGTKKDYLKRSKILFDQFPNLNIIIITLSNRGSHIFMRNGDTSSMKARNVKDAKPVGCGDSFLAGVIASLVSGKDLQYAHQKGTEVSRFVAQNDSATPELLEELGIK